MTGSALRACTSQISHAALPSSIRCRASLPSLSSTFCHAAGCPASLPSCCAVELPLKHPELFAGGLRRRSGVLLYGPPG